MLVRQKSQTKTAITLLCVLTVLDYRGMIHEFRSQKETQKELNRTKELDSYSDMIDSMFMQNGGTHFYDYHNVFARKDEQYFHLIGIKLDWSSRDASLYMLTLYLSSPRLCFFIVIPLDLSVDREDSLTS